MRWNKMMIAIAFGAAGLLVSSGADAQPEEQTVWQTRGIKADFTAVSFTPCGITEFNLWVSETVEHETGKPVSNTLMMASLWYMNACTNESGSGLAYVEGADFSGDLNSASASVALDMDIYGQFQLPDGTWTYGLVGTTFVEGTIEWTGIGELQRSMTQEVARSWVQFYHARTMGVSRTAEVALDITMDGEPLSYDDYGARLTKSHSGWMTVIRY